MTMDIGGRKRIHQFVASASYVLMHVESVSSKGQKLGPRRGHSRKREVIASRR